MQDQLHPRGDRTRLPEPDPLAGVRRLDRRERREYQRAEGVFKAWVNEHFATLTTPQQFLDGLDTLVQQRKIERRWADLIAAQVQLTMMQAELEAKRDALLQEMGVTGRMV